MINVMNCVNKPMNESLDSQLWHAFAGGMVQMPPLNSRVFYFPQGHAEHFAIKNLDVGSFRRNIPSYILCQVSTIKFMADSETDEVYAKIGLLPLRNQNDRDFNGDNYDNGVLGFDHKRDENNEKPSSFAKTLTQSDANNGGGFSVPRYCAETIFPTLDYEAEPPVQNILVKDVHGQIWKFRHIYRGTPRRHLLTTGWSNFVNHKKLVAGDSIVFLKADNGDLCVGIRRAKRGIGGGFFGNSATSSSPYEVGYAQFQPEIEISKDRKASAGLVIEAMNLAANGQAFEVVYYPRSSTPEFCVKASSVKSAMSIQWCPGIRFKMAFETEDSSRISWSMGTISLVQADDQIRWPNSPWRLLQVVWDEPELLQNVKRVNPWLVQLVASMPTIFDPYSPQNKKLRIPQPLDFPLVMMPTGIQGARHSSGFELLSGSNPVHPFPYGLKNHDPLSRLPFQEPDETVSCLLTIGNRNRKRSSKKKLETERDKKKKPIFMLFGQPIFTEKQMSETVSGDTTVNVSDGSVVLDQNGSVRSSSEEDESKDVGRSLSLTALRSDVSSKSVYQNAGSRRG